MSPKEIFLHLRLNWQLILLPIFLWGFWLSGGPIGPKFWVGLVVFHVLFYGGSVAFNSYYDQDAGPIGGLWDPPTPTRALLWFSLAIQAVGLVLVAFVSRPLLIVSLVMFVLSTAYSHPAVRLKSHPWASLLTVSLGQGVGGAVAGWLCGQANPDTLLSARAGLGILTSSLITTGFYPLTQLYQRREDRERGDITFAVQWGRRVFPFAIACLGAAAGIGAYLLSQVAGPWDGAVMAVALLALAGFVYHWWRQFDESQVRLNYLQMIRLGYSMAAGLIIYIAWHLVWRA